MLLVFFSLLILISFIYNIYYWLKSPTYMPNYKKSVFGTIKEGMDNPENVSTYQAYNPSNPIILSQQNAGNIEYLKDRMAGYDKMNQMIFDLSANVSTLQSEVSQLIDAQIQYTQSFPTTPPVITGTNTSTPIQTIPNLSTYLSSPSTLPPST